VAHPLFIPLRDVDLGWYTRLNKNTEWVFIAFLVSSSSRRNRMVSRFNHSRSYMKEMPRSSLDL